MLWPKKNSYEEFDNEKKFLRLENSPPPITFLMVCPLVWCGESVKFDWVCRTVVELNLGSTHGTPSESDVAPVSLQSRTYSFRFGTWKVRRLNQALEVIRHQAGRIKTAERVFLKPSSSNRIVSLNNRTAGRKGRQIACAWRTWKGYNL